MAINNYQNKGKTRNTNKENKNTSFKRKILEVHITLKAGQFSSNKNTIIVRGLATKVKIEKTGPPDLNKATVEICNLSLEEIEKLTTLSFKPLASEKNFIEILAGDEDSDLTLAFSGDISTATADFNGAPDIWTKFECVTGYYGSITAIGPSAIKGSQSVATFIEQKAKSLGYTFRNEGVTTPLRNAVFNGSPIEQIRAAARQVGAEVLIDDGIVILTPFGGKKTGNAVYLSKDTGMLGYPKITNEGIDVEALYNPAFKLNGYIEIKSIVPKTSGVWRIIKLTHELEAFCSSGGPWKTTMSVFLPNETPPNKTTKSKDKKD